MKSDVANATEANDLLSLSVDELYSIPVDEIESFRLRAAQSLFEQVRPKVEFLDKLAKNQGITDIDTLEHLIPILFAHTAYKSYPMGLLERGDFTRLTAWLGQLTAHDLSRVDASSVELIEDWLLLLDAETPLRIATSSATSGKISLLPRSLDEMPAYNETYRHMFLPFGNERGIDLNDIDVALVNFNYRHGFNTNHRRLDTLIAQIAKSEDRCYALYPGRLSPDMLSLAGRIATAEAKGTGKRVKVNPLLSDRREEFLRFQKERPDYIRRFLERLKDEIEGQRVLTLGGWTSILDVVAVGEEMGISHLFSSDSVVSAGGGLKGRINVPDDYQDRALKMFGVPAVYDLFGMTEQTAYMKMCTQNKYHVPPFMIPFALDPDSGESLGRNGITEGRFAFLDLFPKTYWGGFISGDAVIIHWDGGCPCGRTGAYLDPEISRYSSLRGGDDRISCAGVPDAYDKALDYILDSL